MRRQVSRVTSYSLGNGSSCSTQVESDMCCCDLGVSRPQSSKRWWRLCTFLLSRRCSPSLPEKHTVYTGAKVEALSGLQERRPLDVVRPQRSFRRLRCPQCDRAGFGADLTVFAWEDADYTVVKVEIRPARKRSPSCRNSSTTRGEIALSCFRYGAQRPHSKSSHLHRCRG